MKIGYVRVSTQDQNESLQIDALRKVGCEMFFTDKLSGVKIDRAGLEQAIAYARKGDILVVWKFDRAARSLKHLIAMMNDLKERGIEFVSVTEQIDTTTPGGKLVFHMMGALAEFERDLLIERTKAGLEAARARGRKGGRRYAIAPSKFAIALEMYASKKYTMEQICTSLNIKQSTFYRYLAASKEQKEESA